MGLFQVAKPKSASKIMLRAGAPLNNTVLDTLKFISDMVGSSLGPGGRITGIEREEIGMKPFLTKDGVTIMKNLGFEGATEQLVLELVRDATLRTASEAGDGTTTATILSESICRQTVMAVQNNNQMSPQKIVREMQAIVPYIMERLNYFKVTPGEDDPETNTYPQREFLFRVGTVSANGDKDLARNIMAALDAVGDDGNISIIEIPGESRYQVEKIAGYTVEAGYELSCRNFANGFLNDRTGTQVVLEKPIMVLFDGVVNDIFQVVEAINKIGQYFVSEGIANKSIVLVAHGFSDSIIGDLLKNWGQGDFKILPMVTDRDIIESSPTDCLYDLQAYTGMPVFNPVNCPLSSMDVEYLHKNNKVTSIEMSKFRTSVIAKEDDELIGARVNELKARREKPESEYEKGRINIRLGKLTSGIARFNIYGPSQGETREKRDRAEDAWMAIRGALKYGVLPGGGWTLVQLAADLHIKAEKVPHNAMNAPKMIAYTILANALTEPVKVLYSNWGYNDSDITKRMAELLKESESTFDIEAGHWVLKEHLLDSFPAVSEAIRNSLSIASLLGTMGGLIAFKRDTDSDKEEEKFVRRYEQGAGLREPE